MTDLWLQVKVKRKKKRQLRSIEDKLFSRWTTCTYFGLVGVFSLPLYTLFPFFFFLNNDPFPRSSLHLWEKLNPQGPGEGRTRYEEKRRRKENLFSCSLGISQDDSADDASHGAFLLDRISLHKKGQGTWKGRMSMIKRWREEFTKP